LAERRLRNAEREISDAEKEILQLKNEKLILHNQKLEAEYNHLKAQINPHFLFNTLNTFYSNTARVLPETANGIMLLSDMMRYSLEAGAEDGKVTLHEELKQLKNYIELMQLRYGRKLQIQGNILSDENSSTMAEIAHWRILPHLFITIAENAFKHGNKREPFIINLNINGEQLYFTVKNNIAMDEPVAGTGIGIRNLTNRLQRIYGSDCRYESIIEGKTFTAELFITDNNITTRQNLNLAS
jgi:LytS/YehU family sensor histidine kinase